MSWPTDAPVVEHPRRDPEEHLLHLLDEVERNLKAERPDVAVSNLVHAIHVVHGVDQVPGDVRAALNVVLERIGGAK